MANRYYLVPASIAEECGCKGYRHGNDKEGYILNDNDVDVIPLNKVFAAGGREISEEEAKGWVKKFTKNNKS